MRVTVVCVTKKQLSIIRKCHNYNHNLLCKFGRFADSFDNKNNSFLRSFDNFVHLFASIGILGRIYTFSCP